ncbi:sensor histidine kinase [Roseibium aggregatum]|uniref:sensor histidine kinase n=1 Tax=Roseibium aggregatum TaxID=187304 RepID=UPI0005911D11|nr:ATP-binding protein [Roseibium aggregatum]
MKANILLRLSIILVSFILVLWTVFVAYYHIQQGIEAKEVNPTPERLSLILEILRETPAQDREKLLTALRSPFLDLDILPRHALLFDAQGRYYSRTNVYSYSAELGNGLLHVEENLPWVNPFRNAFDWLAGEEKSAYPSNALTFWLGLDAQYMLVARSLVPIVVTPFGLPTGTAAGIIGAGLALITILIFHREVLPLKKFAALVEKIDPAGETIEFPKFRSATSEIRSLRNAFLRLQSRLQTLTRTRMALIGGIQHDIRSFATRLRLRLEALPDELERERAIADINDMIVLLDDALLAAQAGFGSLDQQIVDVDEWLGGEVRDLQSVGFQVRLESRTESEAIQVLADRVALRRVLVNLVENAIKYGVKCRVSLAREEDFAVITVDDWGPGFNGPSAGLLLEPFVRAEISRARTTGGAGLGLAIASSLAEAHGGSIDLGNHPEGGRVSLRLPAFDE